jgi:hypothetical protein
MTSSSKHSDSLLHSCSVRLDSRLNSPTSLQMDHIVTSSVHFSFFLQVEGSGIAPELLDVQGSSKLIRTSVDLVSIQLPLNSFLRFNSSVELWSLLSFGPT